MILPRQALITHDNDFFPASLSKGQILLVVLMCSPILVTIACLCIWWHKERAKERVATQRVQEILRSRALTAAYEADAWTEWQDDAERVRARGTREGVL